MWHAWERREKCTTFWWESPKERDHLEDQGIDGKMGSEWILGRLGWVGGCGLDSTVSGQGPVAGCCECGDEPSGSCTTELVSYELKQNKPWFDEDYSKLLDKRKHAKLQWLQNPSQITGNNLNNVRGKLEELAAKKRGNASKTKLMSLN
jgi:hypothetical protein